jgi:hypothetical protein
MRTMWGFLENRLAGRACDTTAGTVPSRSLYRLWSTSYTTIDWVRASVVGRTVTRSAGGRCNDHLLNLQSPSRTGPRNLRPIAGSWCAESGEERPAPSTRTMPSHGHQGQEENAASPNMGASSTGNLQIVDTPVDARGPRQLEAQSDRAARRARTGIRQGQHGLGRRIAHGKGTGDHELERATIRVVDRRAETQEPRVGCEARS